MYRYSIHSDSFRAYALVKEGDSMRIGFIGAGKMGFTLGKHFQERDILDVTGFYSRNPESAKQAARFTDTKYYDDIRSLVEESEAIFLTVPDGQIAVMADELDRLGAIVEDKILCHTSGAIGSKVFSGMKNHIYGYSIHPIYAVNSKTESYKNFRECYMTIEGDSRYMDYFKCAMEGLGHSVKFISAEDKPKYHAAAVFSSNLVIGLYHMAMRLMSECGFSMEEACEAMKPLFKSNASNLIDGSCESALTGPVARYDLETVNNHMSNLTGDIREVYALLSGELSDIAEQASGRNYDELRKLLRY